jgi:hypothetical protein
LLQAGFVVDLNETDSELKGSLISCPRAKELEGNGVGRTRTGDMVFGRFAVELCWMMRRVTSGEDFLYEAFLPGRQPFREKSID